MASIHEQAVVSNLGILVHVDACLTLKDPVDFVEFVDVVMRCVGERLCLHGFQTIESISKVSSTLRLNLMFLISDSDPLGRSLLIVFIENCDQLNVTLVHVGRTVDQNAALLNYFEEGARNLVGFLILIDLIELWA